MALLLFFSIYSIEKSDYLIKFIKIFDYFLRFDRKTVAFFLKTLYNSNREK